jgi:hypothetical protein
MRRAFEIRLNCICAVLFAKPTCECWFAGLGVSRRSLELKDLIRIQAPCYKMVQTVRELCESVNRLCGRVRLVSSVSSKPFSALRDYWWRRGHSNSGHFGCEAACSCISEHLHSRNLNASPFCDAQRARNWTGNHDQHHHSSVRQLPSRSEVPQYFRSFPGFCARTNLLPKHARDQHEHRESYARQHHEDDGCGKEAAAARWRSRDRKVAAGSLAR